MSSTLTSAVMERKSFRIWVIERWVVFLVELLVIQEWGGSGGFAAGQGKVENMCYCHCNVSGAIKPGEGYPKPGGDGLAGDRGEGGSGGGKDREMGGSGGWEGEGWNGEEGMGVTSKMMETDNKEDEKPYPPIWSPELDDGTEKSNTAWTGNPFAINENQRDTCMADIVFVLDGSGSVMTDNWSKMLQFVQDFAAKLPFGLSRNRIGVISYANEARLDISLNAFGTLAAFQRAVAAIPYMETSTHTAAALELLRTTAFTEIAGDRKNVPNIAIVMTDGESMISPETTIPQANLAREQGIIIFGVGIGFIRTVELKGIANQPDSQFVYEVEDFDTLINRVDDILNAACEVTTCTKNDIAFILDSSGSIGSTNWDKVKQFVGEFANNLAVGPDFNQMGIITYSTKAELTVRLDEFWTRSELADAIQQLPWKNHRTNTSGGIRLARQSIFNGIYGDRRDAPNIAIVMTDGYSNIDADLTGPEADAARKDSVRIFAIGVGDLVEMGEISAIANNPGYHYEFLLRTFDDLVMYTRRIFDVICSPLEPSANLDFSRCNADIAFVLDGSGSVGQDNWFRMIAFLKDLGQRLEIGPQANQIGIVTYGNAATLDVKLNQYGNTGSFVAAMDSLLYKDEETNTAEGIRVMREDLFSTLNGDRPSAPNIAVVITDGESTVNPERTIPEAEASRVAGITVFTIGIGGAIKQEELRGIANSPPENYVYQATDFEDLVNNYEKVLGSACYVAAKEVWKCTFDHERIEEAMCGIIQDTNDQFDWTHHSGPTPSDYTGPAAAYSGFYYIYTEASGPRVEGDEAKMLLPLSPSLSGTYCLRFHAYMFGFHVGALQVFIRRSGNDVTRWTTYGPKGAQWNDLFVDLRLQAGDQVGLRATRGSGYSGDIAVDDLRITEGSCPI